jgi:hypothetical protein
MIQPIARKSSSNHPQLRGWPRRGGLAGRYHLYQRRRLAIIRDGNLTFEGLDCIGIFLEWVIIYFIKKKKKKPNGMRAMGPLGPSMAAS